MDTYALEAHFTDVKPIGVTALGLRLDISFAGQITEGPLMGKAVVGTDRMLLRPDGVGQIDIVESITDGDRVVASIHVLGYVVPPFPIPDLSALTNRDFSWPDVDLPLHGAAFIETAEESLTRAASTVYACTGIVNVFTGTIRVRAHAITRLPELAAR